MLTRLSHWFLIRPGEGRMVGYLSLLFLVVGLGMAVGRSASDALFFRRVGVEHLPQMFFLTSLLLVVFGTIYAEFADRLSAGRLFRHVAVAFALLLFGVWYTMSAEESRAGFVLYFLTYGVASEILLVQLVLYAGDFLSVTQSKRLLPFLNAACRLGAVVGGASLGLVSSAVPLEHTALVWLFTLAVVWAVLTIRHRGERPRRPRATGTAAPKPIFGNLRGGLQFARTSPLLQVAGVSMFVMVVLMSMQDYLASTILSRHFQNEHNLAAFLGWFVAVTNMMVVLLQLFVTNRLLRRFGLKAVSLIFPWSMVATFGLLSVSASLIPAVLARFNYTGMLPAFRNPTAHLFYGAVPDYMHGRAHALSMGLILPLGLSVSGVMLMLVPEHAVGPSLAMAGLVISFIYLLLKVWKNRVYSDALIQLIRQGVFVAGAAGWSDEGRLEAPVVRAIDAELERDLDEGTFLSLADLLVGGAPDQAGKVLLRHLPRQSARVQDQLLAKLAALAPEAVLPHVSQSLLAEDMHLRATALRALEACDRDGALRVAQAWLHEESARLRQEAIQVALRGQDAALTADARQSLERLLSAPEVDERLAALCVVGALGLKEHAGYVHDALASSVAAVRAGAIRAAKRLLESGVEECAQWIVRAAGDSEVSVRLAVVEAAASLPQVGLRLQVLAAALQDEEPAVRRAGQDKAGALMPRTLDEFAAMIREYGPDFRMQVLLARHLAQSGLAGEEELSAMCRRHLQSAWEKRSAIATLAGKAAAHPEQLRAVAFLEAVLGEEVDRHVDLAMEILGHLDSSGAAQAVRAGLASRDPRFRAKAVEAVQHLDSKYLAAQLLPLIEARHDGAAWTRRVADLPETFDGLVAWCKANGSEWLRRVATTLEGEPGHAGTV